MSAHGAAMARRRNKWGTLNGGQQNDTMQQYVMNDTMADKEHKRWLAHKDAALHHTFPTSLEFNGITIPIFKLAELDQLGHKRLRERALNMQDLVVATKSRFFEHFPKYMLNKNAQPEVLMRWMIDVQVALASALGEYDLTHAAFGACEESDLPSQRPADRNAMLEQQRQAHNGLPCWSQEAMLSRQEQSPHKPRARQGNHASERSPPPSFPWSQHGVNDGQQSHENSNWCGRTPQHQGFSLVPPHLQGDESRTHDAASIRQRAQHSMIALG
jgi:hypothetical protein